MSHHHHGSHGFSDEQNIEHAILNMKVAELKILLQAFNLNTLGKKYDLQRRALELKRVHRTHLSSLKSKVDEIWSQRTIYSRGYVDTSEVDNDHNSRNYSNNYSTDQSRPTTRSHVQTRSNSTCNDVNHVQRSSTASHDSTQRSVHQMYRSMPIITANQQDRLFQTPVQPASIALSPPIPNNIQFKELPFYELKATLRDPILLRPPAAMKFNEQTFTYQLTPSQANSVSMSRKISEPYIEYENQIQMRFAIIVAGKDQVDDMFPPGIIVKVNGKLAQLPNPIPTNKPGVEPKRPSRPVDVTSLSRLSPDNQNQVTVTWNSSDASRIFVVGVFLVKKLTSDTLVSRLCSRKPQSQDKTTSLVINKLNCDEDDDICLSSLSASLMCPLGKMKMRIPCRANTCNHIQCFDAMFYISMNEKKPTWNCPICDQPALYKTLIVDELFQNILETTFEDCKDVEFQSDGTWKPACKNPKKESKRSHSPDVSAEILDDTALPSETVTEASDDDQDKGPSTAKKSRIECITLDSDTETEEEAPPQGDDENDETDVDSVDSEESDDSIVFLEAPSSSNHILKQASSKKSGGTAPSTSFVGGTGLGRVPPIPPPTSQLPPPPTSLYDQPPNNNLSSTNHNAAPLPVLDDLDLFSSGMRTDDLNASFPGWGQSASASNSPSNHFATSMSPLDLWPLSGGHSSNRNMSHSSGMPNTPQSSTHHYMSHTPHPSSQSGNSSYDRTSEWVNNSNFFHDPALHDMMDRHRSGR